MSDAKSLLPFAIDYKLGRTKPATTYFAIRDDIRVGIGTYAPGNIEKRSKLAKEWASDPAINNGCTISVDDLAHELQVVEIEADNAFTTTGTDDVSGVGGVSEERPCIVDQDIIAELTWNTDQHKPDFVVFDRHSHAVQRIDTVAVGGLKVVPPACWHGICAPMVHLGGSVLLPSEYDEHGVDEDQLRAEVEAFIRRYVELPDDTTKLCVEYVFMTWVYDNFDELAYLTFRTPDAGRGKSRARETIGSLCYRPLLAGGGSTPAALLRMLDIFGGTLVCDEIDMTRNSELALEVTRLINLGFQRGVNLIKCDGENNNPRPCKCYGPKIFALRGKFPDDASETRMISIWMQQRTRDDIPLNLPRIEFDEQALALRNKLLAYRFHNYGKITADPKYIDGRLEDRANQIGACLLAVAGTVEGRERVVNALLEQQQSVASDRADSWGGTVLEAALAIAEPGDIVRPGDIAKHINQTRADDQGVEVERLKDGINPWRVGQILKGELRLPVEPKDKRSSRYRLEPQRVLQLCQRFGVAFPQTPQTPQRHPSLESPPVKPRSEAENSDSGVCGIGGVSPKGVGITEQQTPPDTSDADERAAIMAVEAEEEAADEESS